MKIGYYHCKRNLKKKKDMDVRDEILNHLNKIDRGIAWLSRGAGINYSTLYYILEKKTIRMSDKYLIPINKFLETKFKL